MINDHNKLRDIAEKFFAEEIVSPNREGVMHKTLREYCYALAQMITQPKGSIHRKVAQRRVNKLRNAVINEHLAHITRHLY